ncbi:MAG: phosphogluconate dehydratase [Desulfocapsaceae bacterium]|nr:phosphogluconate dehydratase [Desulfocapsaceae bacterium]
MVQNITARIIERSKAHRSSYLARLEESRSDIPFRHHLPCSNLAHVASCSGGACMIIRDDKMPNIGIITAYNDLVSAHNPYGEYPPLIKKTVVEAGGICQVAGGVPAMCDGVTQGEPGMDLSLISRDVIAMATVIGLSHNVFDGVLLLGVCDKILPGLLMGALQFGHLPMLLVPSGPMQSGIANKDKARARERFVQGEISRKQMLEYESHAYHSPGTCTFYGTANSNQLMAEMLGMHLPGASFVNAGTPMRDLLTMAAARRVTELARQENEYVPIGHVISEKSVVNAIVGLLASGGSTNETMHLVAIARAAGIRINWDDFSDLSDVVPLIVSIYPNGSGDINSFQRAGGMTVFIKELLENGYLHEDVQTVVGRGLERYMRMPEEKEGKLVWENIPDGSSDPETLTTTPQPFAATGGIKLVQGNLGRAIIKVSALAQGVNTELTAPAMIFHSQEEMAAAFQAGEMNRDMIAVVRFQGPRANGMPELHKLITYLSILMDRGFTVGLVTDGRLSGASGKVPFAIHLTPEALAGGMIAKIRNGDLITMSGSGVLHLHVSDDELAARPLVRPDLREARSGFGRQIFAPLRKNLAGAEEGASSIFTCTEEDCGRLTSRADMLRCMER